MSKYIFVTGGVVSSLGKGVSAASLGALLQSRGYTVHVRKFDPYLNVDPGWAHILGCVERRKTRGIFGINCSNDSACQ